MLVCPALAAPECSATSGAQRVALLELYTSEGCDSCPPAERWLNGLPGRGLAPERVVALAFHVDYWNYLGWVDPYARSEHGERQRAAAHRKSARFVYTPQLLLNGKEYRRSALRDDLPERIAAINRDAPAASIELRIEHSAGKLTVRGAALVPDAGHRTGAAAYVALYENRLLSQVLAGENRGRRLEHDFVVRELAGPYALDAQGVARYSHAFRIDRAWRPAQLRVAAFVQHQGSGEILQALALERCVPG